MGYPTQKPLKLLERILQIGSNENDIVLDAFCGCGTALVAAQKLKRQWIGIDISPTACRVMANRLKKDCGLEENEKLQQIGRGFVVRDLPKTEEELRKYPPFEFENWAVVALGGTKNTRQTGDMGIDGRIYPISAMPERRGSRTGEMDFMDEWYPIQVKQTAKVGRPDIDAFEAVMMREERMLGYFVGFDFTGDAMFEIDRFRRKEGREISRSLCERFWMKKSKQSKAETRVEIIEGIAFDEFNECEVCKKPKYVSAKGICAVCFRTLQEDRADPYLRLVRLKKIAQSESGVIRFARRDALRQTSQIERPFVSALEKQVRHYEHEDDRRIERILGAAPATLAAQRKKTPQVAEIQEISDDLIARLREKPTDFYQLSPRRFEEFVAAMLQKMGYETTLMPATRDKGRDVLAKIRLGTGTMLTIVQCKRNAADRPVGIEIVERFLWTIEHTDRASAGMIVTTSYFSAPVKALAHEFQYKLHLADFDMIQQWVGPLGVWQRKSDSGVWIPQK